MDSQEDPPLDTGEALWFLTALNLVHDLQLNKVDFELNSKCVVDSVYSNRSNILTFCDIILYRRHMLSNLILSHVEFVGRQDNGVGHTLARMIPFLASFYQYSNM